LLPDPMSSNPWLGWDLGGAHIKAVKLVAPGRVGAVVEVACALWKGRDHLDEAIDRVLGLVGDPPPRHAVTMTGELTDLFDDRASGVESLIGAMRRLLPDDRLLIYAGPDGFLEPSAAVRAALRVASANWHATAGLLAARLPAGLLVDLGSTTTDFVPFANGRVHARGYSDHERLVQGELLYTGAVRTPLMSLARQIPFGGAWVSLMAEHFATTADVYRLTGELPSHADLHPSADGRAKTWAASARRVARMVGMDVAAADPSSWRRLAGFLAETQLRTLVDACERILSRGELPDAAPLVGAGVGCFLVKRLAQRLSRPYLPFEGFFEPLAVAGAGVGDCAPAAAVASLAAAQQAVPRP
jgi:(4-(4-[2-(gamma-L-glutamylamino)ethyl]phenoxymethyl)furan-2-yl)methanamine synthase